MSDFIIIMKAVRNLQDSRQMTIITIVRHRMKRAEGILLMIARNRISQERKRVILV